MPSTQTKSLREAGFTLIELLVVAPLVVLLIGVSIGYLSSLIGQSLQTSQKNTLAYNTQTSLDEIESVAGRATGFLTTSGTLTSPRGPNDAQGAFTSNSGALIIKSIATTKSIRDPNRLIINTGTGTCNSSNPLYTFMSIYFIKDGTLYKRTVLPSGTAACALPYQRNSCSPTEMAKANPNSACKVEDEKLIDNVVNFTTTYYSGNTVLSAANIGDADNILVSLGVSKLTSGTTITYSGTLRIKTANDSAETGQLGSGTTTPTSFGSVNSTVDPDTYTCSWESIGSATGYNVQYKFTGDTNFTDGPQNTNATSFSLNINNTRNKTITCQVVALTSNGAITYTPSDYNIALWTDCDLQNGWVNYGTTHATAQFNKSKNGLVLLKGLIKGGTTTNGTPVCQLPPGYRPDGKLMFPVAISGTSTARVEIDPAGLVTVVVPSATWTNLSGIAFMPSGSISMNTLTAYNGWVWSGSPWSDIKAGQDSSGRIALQGLAKNGSTTADFMAYALPAAYDSGTKNIYFTIGGTTTGPTPFNLNGTRIETRGVGANGYWPLQQIFYPSGTTGWVNASLQNSWANFGGGYATPSYKKNPGDDIVSLQGMTKSGSTSSPIFQLPVGHRPKEIIICLVTTSGSTNARIDVNPDGNVYPREGASNTWLSLAGCNFLAEQ